MFPSASQPNNGFKSLYGYAFGQTNNQPYAAKNPVYYYQGTLGGAKLLGYGPFGQLPPSAPNPNNPNQSISKFLIPGKSTSYTPPEGLRYFLRPDNGKPYIGFTFTPNLPDLTLPSYDSATKRAYSVDLSGIIPPQPKLHPSQTEIEKLTKFSDVETDAKSYLNRTQNFIEDLYPFTLGILTSLKKLETRESNPGGEFFTERASSRKREKITFRLFYWHGVPLYLGLCSFVISFLNIFKGKDPLKKLYPFRLGQSFIKVIFKNKRLVIEVFANHFSKRGFFLCAHHLL